MAKKRQVNILFSILIGIVLCVIGVTRYHASLNERLLQALMYRNEGEALTLIEQGANPSYSRPIHGPVHKRDYVLTEAVQTQFSTRVVEALLAHGADPNPPKSVESPLHAAVVAERADLLRLLLAKGAHENPGETADLMRFAIKNKECYQALRQYGFLAMLHEAIQAGDAADVKVQLDQGADVNGMDRDGQTPLIAALQTRNFAIAKLLISRGADVNEMTQYGQTPLIEALQYGYDEIAQLLISRGADVNRATEYETPLYAARLGKKSPPKVVVLLKAKGAHLTLIEAIELRDAEAVRDRLRAGEDVNRIPLQFSSPHNPGTPNPYGAPLFVAIRAQNPEIVRLVLTAGGNVHFKAEYGFTPLMAAAQQGDPDIVRALLVRGVDPNEVDSRQKTAVKYAIEENHLGLYPLLKQNGAKPDLWDAVTVGDVATVRQQAPQGTGVNQPDAQGKMPLMLAAERGQVPALQTLLDLGAKLEATTPQGETALLKAAWSVHPESVRALLDRGANPNAAAKDGKTPLMRAAESGRIEILRLLLAKGANVNARTTQRVTALQLAQRRGYPEAAAILRQAGAEE